MNPRASMPTTLSTTTLPVASRPASASASTTAANAAWSASSGVMSLNTTPGSGKSGTSTTRLRRSVAGVDRPGCGHFLPRLDFGCRVGCARPDDELGCTGPRDGGTTRPRPAASVDGSGRLPPDGRRRGSLALGAPRGAASGSAAIGMSSVNAGTAA